MTERPWNGHLLRLEQELDNLSYLLEEGLETEAKDKMLEITQFLVSWLGHFPKPHLELAHEEWERVALPTYRKRMEERHEP